MDDSLVNQIDLVSVVELRVGGLGLDVYEGGPLRRGGQEPGVVNTGGGILKNEGVLPIYTNNTRMLS